MAEVTAYTFGNVTLWHTGGNVSSTETPAGDGKVRVDVSISGGTFAQRTDERTGWLICGRCGRTFEVARHDGRPITDDEIKAELVRGIAYDCPANTLIALIADQEND